MLREPNKFLGSFAILGASRCRNILPFRRLGTASGPGRFETTSPLVTPKTRRVYQTGARPISRVNANQGSDEAVFWSRQAGKPNVPVRLESLTYWSSRREHRICGHFACQYTSQKACLDLQQAAIVHAIAEQWVRDQCVHSLLVGLKELLSPFRR